MNNKNNLGSPTAPVKMWVNSALPKGPPVQPDKQGDGVSLDACLALHALLVQRLLQATRCCSRFSGNRNVILLFFRSPSPIEGGSAQCLGPPAQTHPKMPTGSSSHEIYCGFCSIAGGY